MYIPRINVETDRQAIVAFMRRFSFATIITTKDNVPVATHLPFVIVEQNGDLILTAHFAKANDQWRDIETARNQVIFMEPHAYISPTHYDKELNVPTWNYLAVHAYGKAKIITETEQVYRVLEMTVDTYETSYKKQWQNLPEAYRLKMANGIVAFQIVVTDLQAKKKLSQNRTPEEQQRIIGSLEISANGNEQMIAEYMKQLWSVDG